MFLAYVDDAGDLGFESSPTRHIELAAVLVHERGWSRALDGLIELRWRLKAGYIISSRARLKTHEFVRGTGSL